MDGGGAEPGPVLRLDRAQVALGGHVQADAVGDSAGDESGESGGTGDLVTVVDGCAGRVGAEVAGEVPEVMEQGGDDEFVEVVDAAE